MSAPLTPEQRAALDAEVQRRIRRALHQIEEAQGLIGDACAILSSLRYAAPEWRATSKLYDRVKAHWYRVRDALEFSRKATKVSLDPLATETLLKRMGQS